MTNNNLPETANLEHLRSQAKDLLREARRTNPEARLHQAQHQLAQSYGFESWPKLVHAVQEAQIARATDDEAIRILENAILDAKAARRVWEKRPELVQRSQIAQLLTLSNLVEPIGAPYPAIAYVAFSPFGRENKPRYREMLAEFIRRGTDPSTQILIPEWDSHPLSILFAAVAVGEDPESVRMLLEAGANPDDNESLYHAAEHKRHESLRLLLQHGATVKGTNALLRVLDFDDPEGLEILLPYVQDLREGNPLVHAIRRGRGLATLQRLIEAGADPNSPGVDGVIPAQLAHERNLGTIGTYQSTEADQLLAACWRGDIERASALQEHYSGLSAKRKRAFTDACWLGRAEAIPAFMAGGFSITERDDSNGTPLHCACFAGHPEVVRALLAFDPPLEDTQDKYQAIPIQWAMHASQFSEGDGWLACVDLLIEAGSPPPVRLFGSDAVQDRVLQRWPDLA